MAGHRMMRRLAAGAMAAALALGATSPALAGSVIDCPGRDAPFSQDTPLVDLLLSPAAKAVANDFMGGGIDKLPPMFGPKAPTFAAILTMREAAGMFGRKLDGLAAADARLRALPVTAADKAARCERYDNDVPRLSLPAGRPRLLLFEKINGFKDVPSFNAAHAAVLAMAERKGWAVAVTDKGGAFNARTLRQFDAVIWNNISGDVLTLTQRRAFRQFIEHGGGFVGIHGSAGDPVYFWDWYADTLIGARFAGHPMDPQFQDARLSVSDASHPAAARLPRQWTMNDEWYSFRNNPRQHGARVIATIDESSYKQSGHFGQNLVMGSDHPMVWSNCIGRGRSFYSAIGHRPETYVDPTYVNLLEDGIAWAATRGACR